MQNTQTTIFGIRAIIEAISAGQTLEKVYIQKGLSGHLFSEFNTLIKRNSISSSHEPIEKLNHISKNQKSYFYQGSNKNCKFESSFFLR